MEAFASLKHIDGSLKHLLQNVGSANLVQTQGESCHLYDNNKDFQILKKLDEDFKEQIIKRQVEKLKKKVFVNKIQEEKEKD
jgi:hypothetical protein